MFRFTHFTFLTREGVVYLVLLAMLLIGALVRQINLLVALYGMLAGPLLLSWGLSRRSLRSLRFARRLPASVPAGDTFVVTLEATNGRKRLPNWALVAQDRIQRDGPGSTGWKPSVLFPFVRPGESKRETYRGTLVRRGRYRFGPLGISTRFPFGLLRSMFSFPLADELLVTPRLGRLTRGWYQRLAQALDSGGTGRMRRQSRDGDFFGLREWRPDDSRRAIHWRSSARRQTLIVRQNEQSRRQDVTIVLELWQPPEPQDTDRENVELAVSFVASLVADLARIDGTQVRFKAIGNERLDRSGTLSPAFVDAVLESLATLEADPRDRLNEVLGDAIDATRPGAALIVVSSRPSRLDDPQRFEEWWKTAERMAWLPRAIIIDTSQPTLDHYFNAE